MRKYSEKFLDQIGKLKNSKIGMEFEFYTKDISYYKALELLNQELSPVKVWGFRQYHSSFETDSKNFKIEPDLSGGSNMVELVTGPMTYFDAKYYLIKIVRFIQQYGYTNDKSSVHFNISFDDSEIDLNDINILKLILNIDEEEIYRQYPSRKGNIYAKSVKNIIPFKEYDFFNIPISVIKNNLKLPNDKYYGINFLNINNPKSTQRLEFRYIGGKDYEKNLGKMIYFLERFIINTYDSITKDFNDNDINILVEYLEENITKYKSLSSYDNFIVSFPTIQIQIDQNNSYELVSSYYNKIYTTIYNIVESVEDLKECIINYVTTSQSIEIVDANIKSLSQLKTIEFINCQLEGTFNDCFFVGCEIFNSHLNKSKLKHSDASESKIINCNVEDSTLKNCYFMEGYLNGSMQGGVYRSGKLGPHASMDTDVKIVKDYGNFFDTKFDDEEDKVMDKGILKYYGKK